MYNPPVHLLGSDVLQGSLGVNKVGRVILLSEMSLLGFLNVVKVSLTLGKSDSSILGVKLNLCGLHEIRRRLKTHQVVLPSVTTAQNIPVYFPHIPIVVATLRSWLGFLEDAACSGGAQTAGCARSELIGNGVLLHNIGVNRQRLSDGSGAGKRTHSAGSQYGSGQHRVLNKYPGIRLTIGLSTV